MLYNKECVYSLNDIKDLDKQEKDRFFKLIKKFRDFDKIDIIIDLAKNHYEIELK